MTLNYVWKFCEALENLFGFNRTIENFCSAVTYFFGKSKIKRISSDFEKTIIVSLWMPSYLENISEILKVLQAKGIKILIFPEWRGRAKKDFEIELQNKFHGFTVVRDLHRALPRVKANVFISSTARKHFYFSDSEKKFFYFHSVAGLSGFPLGGLDDYTDFLCATNQQYAELSQRFSGISQTKDLHKAGYPKLDVLKKRFEAATGRNTRKEKISRIIIAPSFTSDEIYEDVSLLPELSALITKLLSLDFEVVFRPHPVSLRRGNFVKAIEAVVETFSGNERFEFDDSQDYFEAYLNVDLMITDVSGTSLIFKSVFGKPVVFYSPDIKNAIAAFELIPQLGKIADSMDSLDRLIREAEVEQETMEIPELFNLGRSTAVIQEILEEACE